MMINLNNYRTGTEDNCPMVITGKTWIAVIIVRFGPRVSLGTECMRKSIDSNKDLIEIVTL